MPYYADIDTGDLDMTWQAMIGVDYKFESWKLHLNYRHLDYDFGLQGLLLVVQGTVPGLEPDGGCQGLGAGGWPWVPAAGCWLLTTWRAMIYVPV